MVASHKHERVRVALGELVYDAQHPVSAPHLSEQPAYIVVVPSPVYLAGFDHQRKASWVVEKFQRARCHLLKSRLATFSLRERLAHLVRGEEANQGQT